MFIELIETLRCPLPHDDSWLVGAFDRLVDRDVRAGRLGCPVCQAEYPIVDGVVQFSPPAIDSGSTTPGSVGPDAALRIAAMLDLASPGGLVVLEGEWGRAGAVLAGLVETQLLLLNAPPGVAERDGLSAIVCAETIPVASGACRAIALHAGSSSERMASAAATALRARGRLVMPVAAHVPDSFEVLARDATWTVAERSAVASGLVTLDSRRRR